MLIGHRLLGEAGPPQALGAVFALWIVGAGVLDGRFPAVHRLLDIGDVTGQAEALFQSQRGHRRVEGAKIGPGLEGPAT